MIDLFKKFGALFETFDKSGLADFRRFLNENPGVTKWYIAADFCLHDKDRPNNVFAFSIIPHDVMFESIKDEIRTAIPKDWKKSKNILPTAITFLADRRRFHIAFVFPQPPAVFNNGPGSDPRAIARESISLSVDQLIAKGRSADSVRRLKALRQESMANAFNVELLADVFMLMHLFCFVTLLLARERTVQIVGWLPDRDKMTTWCEGVIFDLAVENLAGVAEHFAVNIPQGGPLIALPTPDAAQNAMWFDELIRLPDYVAGILAAWDFETNEIPGEKDKYRVMAQEFAASAENIMVFKVRYDTGFQSCRLVFGKSDSLQTGD
jgi:hypothetical protein